MANRVVAFTEFVDGIRRSVYEDPEGRQYGYDSDGERLYGVWFIPREECDRPIIVDDSRSVLVSLSTPSEPAGGPSTAGVV